MGKPWPWTSHGPKPVETIHSFIPGGPFFCSGAARRAEIGDQRVLADVRSRAVDPVEADTDPFPEKKPDSEPCVEK